VAAPKWGHSEIQDRVTVLLKGIFGSRGTVMMEMPFQPAAEYEVWVADVAFVSRERAERTAKDEYLQGAPDLVVEVLSPSNTVDEINDKMAICLENGCSSFWVIDPKPQRSQSHRGRHHQALSGLCDDHEQHPWRKHSGEGNFPRFLSFDRSCRNSEFAIRHEGWLPGRFEWRAGRECSWRGAQPRSGRKMWLRK